jgi:hypothetical protein
MQHTAFTLRPNWVITLAGDDPLARFAAGELRRTLQRIGAPPLPIVAPGVSTGPQIELAYGGGGDGFTRAVAERGLRLSGAGPRGLLYAVYDLLEALGCRWVTPGIEVGGHRLSDGERLPRYSYVTLPTEEVARWPALPGRCMVIGHDFFLNDAEEWIVWAARNRLNSIFVHTIDAPLALAACRLEEWQRRRGALLPLLRERGLALELGGHGMSALVPRALFESVPQAFRHNGQRRTPDYNFCPSSPEALALLRRNGGAFFRRHPEAGVLHLWPDDILGGGWCRCERCAVLSPSDQALIAANTLADTLAEIAPGARLAHLAYHDTQGEPASVRPRPNVVLCYAPRSRSYGQAFGDPASLVNAGYASDLRRNIAAFGGPWRAGAGAGGEHRVFEYYLDGLLFKSAPPPLLATLPGDMQAYREAGVHTVQALMTGDRPWLAAPLNAYLFARLAWDPGQPMHELLEAYATTRAPHAPAALERVYKALSLAWQPALAIVPGEVTQRLDRNPVGGLPADVLDYMEAPKRIRERRLELISRSLPLLELTGSAWAELGDAPASATEALEGERREWELSMLQLRFVAQRQRLYVLESREAAREVLHDALEEAQATLDAIFAWAADNLPDPRARAGFDLLHQLAQLQLDALRGRRLHALPTRAWLRARGYGRIGGLLARLMIHRRGAETHRR